MAVHSFMFRAWGSQEQSTDGLKMHHSMKSIKVGLGRRKIHFAVCCRKILAITCAVSLGIIKGSFLLNDNRKQLIKAAHQLRSAFMLANVTQKPVETTHQLSLKVRVPVGVTTVPTVAAAAPQGGGQLLVLTPQLADGAPQVQHQLVLGVQDTQGVALHPESHAGKVQRVQCLLCMRLQPTQECRV